MRGNRLYIDLIIVIVIMVGAITLMPTLFIELEKDNVSRHEDKTALDVTSAIYLDNNVSEYDDISNSVQYKLTGGQLVLMLLVQDMYSQYPNKVRIGNNYYVNFTPAYVADKYEMLEVDYDTYIKPYVNTKTKRVLFMYPSSTNPGVTDNYFWYQF